MGQETMGTFIGTDPKYDGEMKGGDATVSMLKATPKATAVKLTVFDLLPGQVGIRFAANAIHFDYNDAGVIKSGSVALT